MAMVVRTNYSALNATRNLNLNNKALDGSLEKLASGYKVNKAADDASGLAISEKMKGQIKALDTAAANAEDGISLLQTTEGYLSEIHDMLNRMVTLSMKSANGIMEATADISGQIKPNSGVMAAGGTDRDALQIEMNQLCAEIDRIASTANFNNVKLFDGGLSVDAYSKLQPNGTRSGINASLQSGATSTIGTGLISDQFDANNGIQLTGYNVGPSGVDKAVSGTDGLRLQIGETSKFADKLQVSIADMSTAALFFNIKNFANYDGTLNANAYNATSNTGGTNLIQVNTEAGAVGLKSAPTGVGADVEGFTINISNQNSASLASDAIRTVVNDVSKQRAEIGGMQNRLDYTINNLETASENMQNANSRIRDTDVAKEMARYTKSNVLVQSATAMLAQANSRPQQALQLIG